MHGVSFLLRALARFSVARPEARRFAARAWLGAPLVQASLSAAGLQRTLRFIHALPARARKERSPVGPGEGAALVASAFRFHVVRGACLPQALLQYALHRRDGVKARLVVGVRRDGAPRTLAAHAWVEPERAAPEAFAAPPLPFTPLFVKSAGDPAT